MEFNPNNPIIRLCVQGMDAESKRETEEAKRIFLQAWHKASNDFEKFLAAYYVARCQYDLRDKLKWNKTALAFASKINDLSAKSALPALYSKIAECYEDLDDRENAKKNRQNAVLLSVPADNGPFYHGTRADLKTGNLLTPGGISNYDPKLTMNHIYFTALKNGAGLAAALAKGEGSERVYIIEPTGAFENDPNVTDKKFPGNPTRSYRSSSPLRIVGEVTDWIRQTPEQVKQWREKLANNKGDIIN